MIRTVEIRRAFASENDQVADCWLRSRQASVPAIPPPVHDADEVRDWLREMFAAGSDLWVACTGQQIVGLLVLEDDWIDQLYVDPGWTGLGVGSDLVRVAKELHPTRLRLWTFESNTGARRFYERHGFAAQEVTDGAANEERAADVRYEWHA